MEEQRTTSSQGLEGSSLAAASPLRTPKERLAVLQRKGGAVLTTLPPKPAARSRLIIGDFGPSDSALAAASGGRLRRPAADRHAARCASRDLCSGVRPSALYALEGAEEDFYPPPGTVHCRHLAIVQAGLW